MLLVLYCTAIPFPCRTGQDHFSSRVQNQHQMNERTNAPGPEFAHWERVNCQFRVPGNHDGDEYREWVPPPSPHRMGMEDVGINSHWLKFVVMRVWHLLMWSSPLRWWLRTCTLSHLYTQSKCRKCTCSDGRHGHRSRVESSGEGRLRTRWLIIPIQSHSFPVRRTRRGDQKDTLCLYKEINQHSDAILIQASFDYPNQCRAFILILVIVLYFDGLQKWKLFFNFWFMDGMPIFKSYYADVKTKVLCHRKEAYRCINGPGRARGRMARSGEKVA